MKVGDLVRVKDNTHDAGIPSHRMGLIIEHSLASGNYTEAYTVAFLGTNMQLRFHEMFLEIVNNESR